MFRSLGGAGSGRSLRSRASCCPPSLLSIPAVVHNGNMSSREGARRRSSAEPAAARTQPPWAFLPRLTSTLQPAWACGRPHPKPGSLQSFAARRLAAARRPAASPAAGLVLFRPLHPRCCPSHRPASAPWCRWSGLVYQPFKPSDDFYRVDILLPKSCDDPLITDPRLRRMCKACAAEKTQPGCLARVAQDWHRGLGGCGAVGVGCALLVPCSVCRNSARWPRLPAPALPHPSNLPRPAAPPGLRPRVVHVGEPERGGEHGAPAQLHAGHQLTIHVRIPHR